MHPFFVALEFLTRVPAPMRRGTSSVDLERSIAWFPAVGALLGAALVVIDSAAQPLFGAAVANALLIAFLVSITGALHLDGLVDAVEGLAGGPDAAARLATMRQPTAGALGATAAILLLIGDFAALGALPPSVRAATLFLCPVCGRTAILLAYRLYPYARSEPSLSQTLKAGATTVRAIGGLAAAFGLAAVAAGVGGVCLLMLSVFAMLVMAHIALLRIPGLTGDTYGAIAESTQLVALLAAPLVIQL